MSRNTQNSSLAVVWEDLSAAFDQLNHWLMAVSPEHYRLERLTAPGTPPHGQTPGRHLRHITDHFDALFAGLRCVGQQSGTTPVVDYEQRARNPRLETDPTAALALVQQQQRLCGQCCDAGDQGLMVIHRTDLAVTSLPSSLSRELIFLSQHSVHHMAIIELLMLWQGVSIAGDFGVNPSTRRYQVAQRGAGVDAMDKQRREVNAS